jgi:hypothetical protein
MEVSQKSQHFARHWAGEIADSNLASEDELTLLRLSMVKQEQQAMQAQCIAPHVMHHKPKSAKIEAPWVKAAAKVAVGIACPSRARLCAGTR